MKIRTKLARYGVMVIAQLMSFGPAVADSSFPLQVGRTEARVVGVPQKGVDTACLTNALEKILSLHRSRGLEQIKTELTVDHEVVKKLLRGPHVILPLETGKQNLAISIKDDANVIVPFVTWDKNQSYGWYSASGLKTGINGCLK